MKSKIWKKIKSRSTRKSGLNRRRRHDILLLIRIVLFILFVIVIFLLNSYSSFKVYPVSRRLEEH